MTDAAPKRTNDERREPIPRGTTARVVSVLDVFRRLPSDDLGVSDISRESGLDKSVVHRIVSAFVQAGFLAQDPSTRRFRVGLPLWELGQRYGSGGPSNLIEIATSVLDELLHTYEGTGYLGHLDGWDAVYMATVHGRGPLQVNVAVGARIPAHASALGKAILANLPPNHPTRTFPPGQLNSLTPSTLTDPSDLEAELDRTHKRGYSTNHQEQVRGVGALGVALHEPSGLPVASISVGFPLLPDYDRLWTVLPDPLKAAARTIEARVWPR